MPLKLAILLSGRGSNFAAIHDAIERGELDAQIVCVVSNRADAAGVVRAREWGLETHVVENGAFASRAAHEMEVLRIVESAQPDFVILAGYMRLLSADFVAKFPQRILNIHPSLLPAFPGVDAQKQAIDYGVKVSGCTVHLVDEFLDAGPIIVQRSVPVLDGDTAETLAVRILEQEHEAYVEALRALSTRGWRMDGRRVVLE